MAYDRTAKKFDLWSRNGMAEKMEKGHKKSVLKMLETAVLKRKREFLFLDVGCGNGWVVREAAANPHCARSVGIDSSAGMIKSAKSFIRSDKEEYFCAGIEQWSYKDRFDCVFSMESLYYAKSIKDALATVYRLLKPGGVFLCGTDFYSENTGTARWASSMGISMYHLPISEWKSLFIDAGFKTRYRHIRDPNSRLAWRQKMGTLFLTGVRPQMPNQT